VSAINSFSRLIIDVREELSLCSGILELTAAVRLPVGQFAVAFGELCGFENTVSEVLPFAAIPDQGTESANQQLAHDVFVGVALQGAPAS